MRRLDARSSLLCFDPAKVFGSFQFAIPLDESLGVVMERLAALGGVAVNAGGFVRSVVGKVGFAAVVVVAFVCTDEERNGCGVGCFGMDLIRCKSNLLEWGLERSKNRR